MKLLSYIIPVLNILVLLIYLVILELDIKFFFGAEQSEYVFNKGQALGERAFIFITILIISNVILIGVMLLQKKTNQRND